MSIRLAQCLCGPRRHAILAMGLNDDAVSDAEALALLRTAVAELLAGRGAALGMPAALNPWCELCRSRAWIYEVGRTRLQDWDATVRELRELEAQQAASRALLQRLRTVAAGN